MLVNCSRGLGERSGPAEQHIYTLINATKRCDVMSCGGGGVRMCVRHLGAGARRAASAAASTSCRGALITIREKLVAAEVEKSKGALGRTGRRLPGWEEGSSPRPSRWNTALLL
jgi:hypothetical protein